MVTPGMTIVTPGLGIDVTPTLLSLADEVIE
jgi:hypothetical protein